MSRLILSLFAIFFAASCGDTDEPSLNGELPNTPRADATWSSITGEFADARIDVGLCPSSEMVVDSSGNFRALSCRRDIRGTLSEVELARFDDIIIRAIGEGSSNEVTCVGPANPDFAWNYVVDLPDGSRERVYFSDSIRGSCASIPFASAAELDQIFDDLLKSKTGTPRSSRPLPGPPSQPIVGITRPVPLPAPDPIRAPIPVPGPVFEPAPFPLPVPPSIPLPSSASEPATDRTTDRATDRAN